MELVALAQCGSIRDIRSDLLKLRSWDVVAEARSFGAAMLRVPANALHFVMTSTDQGQIRLGITLKGIKVADCHDQYKWRTVRESFFPGSSWRERGMRTMLLMVFSYQEL